MLCPCRLNHTTCIGCWLIRTIRLLASVELSLLFNHDPFGYCLFVSSRKHLLERGRFRGLKSRPIRVHLYPRESLFFQMVLECDVAREISRLRVVPARVGLVRHKFLKVLSVC